MLRRQGVTRVVGDRCGFGLKLHDGQREGPARKRIGFMTSAFCIAKRLSRRCLNTMGNRPPDHVTFINGRAKAPQVYPTQLCRVVCQGFIEQIEADRAGQFLIAEVNPDKDNSAQEWKT